MASQIMPRVPLALLVAASVSYCSGRQREEAQRDSAPRVREDPSAPILLGYFHGGKTFLLFRAYINGNFARAGLDVRFFSDWMKPRGLAYLPPTYDAYLARKIVNGKKTHYGKVTGTRIADAIAAGEVDGGTIGETSFVDAVTRGIPLVAVAMLARDERDRPAKAIVLRKGLEIRRPQELRGKTLVSRRGGRGEALMLREYLATIGLKPGVDVTVRDQIPEDQIEDLLYRGEVDGGLYHVNTIRRLLKADRIRIYRRMDWMNPELSHGLLVFHRHFVEARPKTVEMIVRAYLARIRFEAALSTEERAAESRPGLRMVLDVPGMNLPQTDDLPQVKLSLLNEIQRLMLKHGFIDKKVELYGYVDNRFVEGNEAELH